MANVTVLTFLLGAVCLCHATDIFGKYMILTSEEQADSQMWSDECAKENKITMDHLKMVERNAFTPSRALKCYMSCYFQKYGSMDSTGKYNLEKLKRQLHKENYEIVVGCATDQETVDLCDRAYEAYFCYLEGLAKLNLKQQHYKDTNAL